MATSYTQGPNTRTAVPAYGWSLLEALAVFLFLAAPLYWTTVTDLYLFMPLAVVLGYVIGAPLVAFLDRATELPSTRRVAAFSLAQLASAVAMAAGFSVLVSTVWFHAAYRTEILDPHGFGLGFPLALASALSLALGLIVAAAAVFLAATTLLRRDRESVGACLKRIGDEGFASLWPAAAAWLLLGFGVLSLANVVVGTFSLPPLLQAANPDRTVVLWDVAEAFPLLPAALLASSVLMVAFRRLQPAALASLRAPRRPSRGRVPGLLTAVASVGVGYGWYLQVLHIGIVASLGATTMIVSWGEVSRATDAWIAAQEAEGREPAAIAAELRTQGGWSAEGPGPRRPGALSQFGGTLEELGLSDQCRITIDARVADNSALRNEPWIAGYEAGFRPLPAVGYCLRLACPSPAVWHERPVVILHSSHPSRNRGWSYNLFVDLFAQGRAPAPGGYCTADGRLAGRYQG